MTHISISKDAESNANPAWRETGIAIGELVNEWAGRSDIIAEMCNEHESGAPALFKPLIAEVAVSTNQVFPNVKPEQVGDFRQSDTRYEFSHATGAILHEALHARYSRFSLEQASEALSNEEFQALMLLEEGRIEAQGVREMPWGKNFLKACAMDLVIADSEEGFKENSTVGSAINLVALVRARIIAGVLETKDVAELERLIAEVLSEEVIAELSEVIKKAQAHTNHYDATELYKLAKQWVKISNREKKKKGESTEKEQSQMMKEFAGAMQKAMKEASESIQISSSGELHDQQDEEKREAFVKQSEELAKEKQENEEQAKSTYAKSGLGIRGSKLVEERMPSSEERVAAVKISKALEKAKYRDRSEVEISSVTPPGRLRTRALVQANAMRSRGVVEEVAPWRRTVRKHTENPELTIGVMVDISGSMSPAMKSMASTAWVLGEAGRRIQARTSMVYFGSSAFATLKPGQHLDKVKIYTAEDSTEEFDEAFRALDGSLNLLRGDGARLLVVVSDGVYRRDQDERARSWVRRCGESGVGVLWMPFQHYHSARPILRDNPKAELVDVDSDATSASSVIAKSAVRALEQVS